MATQPTLAMIPSGYKDGKLYSVLPSDGVGDFDVTRGSNATRINKDGLIETVTGNTPRLNYPLIDGVVSGCPSLLLEPQSTNLITYPLSFDNSYWTKSGATVTSGFSSPSVDNPTSAFKLVEDTSTGGHYFRHPTLSSSSYDTFSLYAKASERYLLQIYNGGDGTDSATFDLKEGTAVNNGVGVTSIIESIGNGWYRCLVTTNSKTGVYIFMQNAGSRLYEGDGTSGVYIFGAQLEASTYATSLMLPNTQGQQATRFADTANNAGNASTFNDSEGVLFTEVSRFKQNGVVDYLSLGIFDSSGNNAVVFKFRNSLNVFYVSIESTLGSPRTDLNYTFQDLSLNTKIAVKYKSNEFALWVNGIKVVTDNSGYVPTGLNQLKFTNFSGAEDFYGNTKQLQYFDTVLTDSELEKLTSWTSFRDMAQGQLYSIK